MTTSERFGPYLLLKKIGRGGMAELFLARQTGVAPACSAAIRSAARGLPFTAM